MCLFRFSLPFRQTCLVGCGTHLKPRLSKAKRSLDTFFSCWIPMKPGGEGTQKPYLLWGNAVSKPALYTYWKVSDCWCLFQSPTSYSLWTGNMFTPRQAWPADKLLYSSLVLLCCWDLGKAMYLKFTFPSPGNPPAPSFLGARTPLDYNCPSVPSTSTTTKKQILWGFVLLEVLVVAP